MLPLADCLALVVAITVIGVTAVSTAYAVFVLALLAGQGLHRLRICRRVSDQVPRLAVAAIVPAALLGLWAPVAGTGRLALATTPLVVAFRGACYALLRAAHRRGWLLEPTLLVGSGSTAARVAQMLVEHPELGLSLSRCLAGSSANLPDTVARHGISRVVVCFGREADADLVEPLRACRRLPVDVCVVPRLYELGAGVPQGCLDELGGIPLVPLRRHTRADVITKRVFDLLVGTVLLIAVFPALLVLAVAVRARDGQHALFQQVRVTHAGRQAAMVKLRTVTVGRGGDDDTAGCWTVPAEYCTPFGRWLRATHLDELPQLFNVLRGDMSLVGPRPERPWYAERFAREIPRYDDRHRLPGGMTGWAQVHGLHGDTSIPDRARFDNHYIEYWTPWLDIVVLARTVAIVMRGVVRASKGRAAIGGAARPAHGVGGGKRR